MSRISLESVVNKNLINKFRGLASGAGGSSAGQQVVQALRGGGQAVTIADGLRQGAQTFVTAVKGINSAISVVNVSRGLLEKLGDITDKMIALADRASQAGVGTSKRSDLDREFKKLGSTFKQTIERAKIGDREILTVEGLSQIFQTVGLDRENSDSIAKVFAQFIINKEDDSLASSNARGSRPVNVPRASFRGPASDITYNPQKISDSAVSGSAQIATGTNIFVDNDNILNQNPSYNALFMKSANGTLSTLQAGMLDRNFDTLSVNESTGYSLIGTTQNLGNNASNEYVAYLLDNNGQVVHRFEDFDPTPGATFESATSFQISSDNTTISYIQREADATTRTYKIMQQVAASFSTTGGTSTPAELDSIAYNYSLGDPISSFDTLRMSDDGANVAYNQFNGSLGEYYTVFDAWSQALGVPLDSFEFIDDDKLVFVSSSDNQVHTHTLNSGSSTALTSGLSDITHLKAVQAAGTNSGYFVLDSDIGAGQRRLELYSATSTTAVYSLDLQATDSISSLSVAYNVSGQAELGVLGTLESLSDDSDVELYRFTANSRSSGQRFERMSKEFDTLFSSEANIRSRADAFRMGVDLKALKKQISENMEALDGALETLGKNMELARAMGLACLDASSTVTSAADASAVANTLRNAIRSNAPKALSQAENLEPMIVAALTLDLEA